MPDSKPGARELRLLRITTVPISLRLLITGQAKFMANHGMEVLLCSADGPEVELVRDYEKCPHVIVPFTRAITPLHDLRCLRQLVDLMRRFRPDIVHTHTPKAGLLGMLAARMARVPVRIHTVAGLPYMTTTGNRRRLLVAMERLTCLAATNVWPNSRSILNELTERKICSPDKLEMIGQGSTNGIDLAQFSPESLSDETLTAVKREMGYDPACRYLVVVGRLVRDKGIIEMLAAFRGLSGELPDLRLVLLGPLEEERAEETLPAETVEELTGNPAIVHIPWTDEVPAYLHLAHLLVHPSHREGFPNVLLQAGAMGCPIVCSRIPGNVDIVSDDVTGLLFPVGDVGALTEELRRALTRYSEVRLMADELLQEIRERYDRGVIHQTLLRRYRELAASEER
ncbi:glycosyltransferase family 4 protein [Lewinella sp. IMCC34183]|uniref:glycosyltransferase family 4 protein n=1 Tax=Lewinella sp. IMCC34183 TaxID=2248762 RepID=UPI000E21DE85|nr:glycosyltransferase family 4 protein [Lewinella sp. IMCC34183]